MSKSKKILLVDDEADVVEILRQGLELGLAGYKVDAFTSSSKALEVFSPETYDLAILDIRMPGITGMQLFRELQKQDPNIKCVFFSAFEINQNEIERVFPSMQSVGVVILIRKPIHIDALLNDIKTLLRLDMRSYKGKGM